MPSPVRREFWLIGVQLLALHPVWQWYAARLSDGSDEPWGLVALITALGFFCLGRPSVDAERKLRLVVPSLLLVVYAAAYPFAPPLIRGAIGIAALACTLSELRYGRVIHTGLLGLCLLSLPVMATLQFYLGYPFSVLSGMLAAPLLRLSGLPVVQEAACLRWGAELVSIDAPCSGVRMLWACMFLACTLAVLRDLSWPRTLLLAAVSLLAALAGNALRTAALFHLEIGIVNAPAWWHEGAGLVVFALVAGGVLVLANRIGKGQRIDLSSLSFRTRNLPRPSSIPALSCWIPCLLAALVPLLPYNQASTALKGSFPGWPTQFESRPLKQTGLSAQEEAFARNFPGRIARFTDGNRTLLIRWVMKETRKLHSAADCFRGMGYGVVPGSLQRDGEGNLWSTFEATRHGRVARVCERIYDGNGKSWTDVSAWYWAALLGRSRGPWWAITVVEELSGSRDSVLKESLAGSFLEQPSRSERQLFWKYSVTGCNNATPLTPGQPRGSSSVTPA